MNLLSLAVLVVLFPLLFAVGYLILWGLAFGLVYALAAVREVREVVR